MTDTSTAVGLVKDGLCSALCLLAAQREAVTCNCPCGGAYHAKLATITLELAPGHTRKPLPVMPGQLALEFITP